MSRCGPLWIFFTLFALFALVMGKSACSAVGVNQTAQTVPPGEIEMGFSVAAGVLHEFSETSGDETSGEESEGAEDIVTTGEELLIFAPDLVAFIPEAWLRVGVASHIDLEMRVFPFGLHFAPKLLWLKNSLIQAAFLPGYGFSFITGRQGEKDETIASIDLDAMLLFSTDFSSLSLYLAPRYIYTFRVGNTMLNRQAMGGTFGLKIPWSKGVFTPEITLFWVDPFEQEETREKSFRDFLIVRPGIGFGAKF